LIEIWYYKSNFLFLFLFLLVLFFFPQIRSDEMIIIKKKDKWEWNTRGGEERKGEKRRGVGG
jgi:tricorn protease-like protein